MKKLVMVLLVAMLGFSAVGFACHRPDQTFGKGAASAEQAKDNGAVPCVLGAITPDACSH